MSRVLKLHATIAAAVNTLLAVLAVAPPARAQSPADFYRGKNINMLIGVGVGGEYDLLARLVTKYLPRHLPGNPAVVAQNMTGASGLKMLNFMYAQAPRDGTYIGIVQNALPAAQAAGLPGIQFDATKFPWLGSISPVVETMALWHTTSVTSIAEATKREIVIGATAKGAITYTYPALMNEFFGTKFKIVTGYNGGNEINLAMERGEAEGRNNSWSSWKTTKPDWLRDKKITIIAQAGPRAADLDAPSIETAAKTADDRRVIELIVSGGELGRPFVIAPGAPADRIAALRAAFDAVMKDPEFLAEAATLNFEVAPISGKALGKIVERVMATPRDLAARARRLLE